MILSTALKYRVYILGFTIAAVTASIAIPITVINKIKSTNIADNSLRASPQNLSSWSDSFDINTDWEKSWPETGVIRTYTFSVTEVDQYVGADDVVKEKAMLVNGVSDSNWGDRIHVTVFNNLRTNGTSIHWHGFQHPKNNINDGTSGVTECPIAPGHSKTYSFQATQYGTSWYHSHISGQYANGILGAIHIDGPASYDYDIDLGVFPISDWYYGGVDNLLNRVSDPLNPFVPGLPGSPPTSDNVFFNGTNINPQDLNHGNYAKITFTPGKRHRLRLINASTDNAFTISIVGHTMAIIATDFVPVNPYPVDSVHMVVGQRLDVVIDANQPVDTYWLNATFSGTSACGSSKNPHPAAIIQYTGAPWWAPSYQGTPPRESYCADDISPVPVVPRTAPFASFSATPANTLNVSLAVNTTLSKVFWEVNSSTIDVRWDKPTLQNVLEGDYSLPRNGNVVEIPNRSQWSFWLIQNVSPIPHPMHLHGHDFVIVGRSDALTNPLDPANVPVAFNPATDAWRLSRTPTPIRRDTTVLPAFGWLIVAFETSNPGAWIFHCHIVWHLAQGLSVQFLERPAEISAAMDIGAALNMTCPDWRAYAPNDPFAKADSGLRL
ncbi:Cupredoxin [Podospora appendiculata]|uniref:laccase n=1 Tax=Podospora appendiculata TaxID=314037 RepID=A0AAE0X2P0_9PEZI|nr:Cupredoxin [Podospora appendiculata]